MAVKYWDGTQWLELASGERGPKGDTGNGISTTVLNADYTLTITYTNGQSVTVGPIRGAQGDTGPQGPTGATGNGIASTVLNADYTLTITFTDGTSYTTPSIRGAQGDTGPSGPTGSITATEVKYQVSQYGTTVPTGTWLDDIPSVPSGYFLWSRTRFTFTDGTISNPIYMVTKNGEGGGGGGGGEVVTSGWTISNFILDPEEKIKGCPYRATVTIANASSTKCALINFDLQTIKNGRIANYIEINDGSIYIYSNDNDTYVGINNIVFWGS